jgi:hypothetical protein
MRKYASDDAPKRLALGAQLLQKAQRVELAIAV